MPAALILALTIPALAASAEPQLAVPAPREAAPRDATQEVKAGGVIRGRITSLDTGKPLRRAVEGPRQARRDRRRGGEASRSRGQVMTCADADTHAGETEPHQETC